MHATSHRLALPLALLAAASASDAAPTAQPVAPAASPLRLESIEVQDKGGVQRLRAKERVQPVQDFAVRIDSKKPLYLYVLLEHADGRRALFHPRSGGEIAPMSGKVRLPQKGDDWFSLEKPEAGDRVCLIGSERALSEPSCADDNAGPLKSRGEDKPPPPPERRTESPSSPRRPPPPPPDDRDRDRGDGRRKWVILLPLAAP